jgi:hypothetical protein
LTVEKRCLETKEKQIKNRPEEISVKVPNREERKKFKGGDKTKLNEYGGENVGRKYYPCPTVGVCEQGCQF